MALDRDQLRLRWSEAILVVGRMPDHGVRGPLHGDVLPVPLRWPDLTEKAIPIAWLFASFLVAPVAWMCLRSRPQRKRGYPIIIAGDALK